MLRRIVRKVPRVALQIATVARLLGNYTVVPIDGDFSVIPGLKGEHLAP